MAFDIDMIRGVYERMPARINAARELLGRPLTLTEKILYSHLWSGDVTEQFERGKSYVDFAPDRVAMQDATAQMALLQFMQAGKPKTVTDFQTHVTPVLLNTLDRAELGTDEYLPVTSVLEGFVLVKKNPDFQGRGAASDEKWKDKK